MKVNVRRGAIAFLLVAGCNRPDNSLFGSDGFRPIDDQAGAGNTQVGGSGTAGGMPMNGGGTPDAMAGGGTGSKPVANGGSAAAGGPAAGGGGGGNPPEPQAGAPDGAAGAPEPQKPPPAVCGNGILEPGEACDDAGHTGKDGCDAKCNVVCADFGPGTIESEDHHCYNGFDQAAFDAAQAACVKRGAHLASITSAAENELVRTLVDGSKWLGGREDVPLSSRGTGRYTWLTDEALSYTNWAEQEPDHRESYCGIAFNTVCYEHCISMLGDGSWADARCDIIDGYVCEWEPAGTKP